MRILHLTTEFPPVIYGGLGTAVGGLVEPQRREEWRSVSSFLAKQQVQATASLYRHRRHRPTTWRRNSLLGRLFSKSHGFKKLKTLRRQSRCGGRTFFTCIHSGCGRSREPFATGSGNRSSIPSIRWIVPNTSSDKAHRNV